MIHRVAAKAQYVLIPALELAYIASLHLLQELAHLMSDQAFPGNDAMPELPALPPLVGHKRRFASLRAIGALVLREMSATNGRSPGGYLWAILEPAAGVALLTVIFSMAFHKPALGSNFALFYASGLVPLTFFTSITGRVGQSVAYSRQLLAYPSVTVLDAILARFLLNALTQVLVAAVIFTGIFMFYDTKTIVNLPSLAVALAMVAAFSLGVGILNCFMFTKFPIWVQLWSILTRPLFVVSCVFNLYDQVPGWAREWLWYNPIVHIVGMTRHGFYPSYHATYVSVPYVMGVSLLAAAVGLMLLYRQKDDLL